MKIIILITTAILLQNCQSQSNFDLTHIKLDKDKISDIIPKNIKFATYDAGLSGGDLKFSSIESEKITIFNKYNFAGNNPKAYSKNDVFLRFNKKDSIVTRFTINIFTTKESNEMLEVLKKKLGSPNYTGFSEEKDKINNNPSIFMWEDKKNGIFYHAQHTKQHYGMDLAFNVLPIKKVYPSLPGITDWESFMFERNKRKDPNYTYQQFLIDETERDSDNYYNKVSK